MLRKDTYSQEQLQHSAAALDWTQDDKGNRVRPRAT